MCVLGAHTSPKWGPPHGSVSLRNREAGPHEDPLQGPGATHPQGLSLRVPPRQGPPHRWGPGPVVLPASREGHARAGSCSLGPSVGSRPPQTAACGGAARTDRSLWGGAGSGPAATTRGPHRHLCRSTGDPGGPQAGTLKWAASTGQGTSEQAVLLGVLGKEGAKVSGQGREVIGALVLPQGPGKGVKAGLAQRLLHGCHEQLGPACVRAGFWPLLRHTAGARQEAPTLPIRGGQRAAVGGCWGGCLAGLAQLAGDPPASFSLDGQAR